MWRSLLFVPILNERLVNGAAGRNADAIVLDLEAAVPLDRKEEARASIASVIASLKTQDAIVGVRVNLLDKGGVTEIPIARDAGADLLVLPSATIETTMRAAHAAGSELPLIPLVEDPRGVIDALPIAEAAETVVGLGLGVEDYATEMGAAPEPELLVPAAFQVIQAARAAGREPLVLPDSIANYQDMQRFESAARKARALGASGSFAIHPAQVAVLNDVFTPSQEELDSARRIVEAADLARKRGESIATVSGQMIDAPVEARARAILERAHQRQS